MPNTDFNELVSKHAAEDGSIPQTAIPALLTAIKQTVGNEYVDKARYKAKLDAIDELTTKAQTADDNAQTAGKWEKKYNDEHTAFEAYKTSAETQKTAAQKSALLTEALKTAGVTKDSCMKALLKSADVSALTVKDGKLENADAAIKTLKDDFPDFFGTTVTEGVPPATPPAGGGTDYGTMSDADYYKATYEAAKKKG